MKITDVKLRFAKHYLFVQIYTDAGITGLGELVTGGIYRPQQLLLKSLQIT